MHDLFELPDENSSNIKKNSRPRCEIWDCVESIWYRSGVPEPYRKQVNRFVAALKKLGATPESIRRAANAYKIRFPKLLFTLAATVKYWDQLAEPEKPSLQPGIPMENQSPETLRRYREWKEWQDRNSVP